MKTSERVSRYGALPYLLAVFVAEMIVTSFLYIPKGRDIFEIAFGFGPYIRSLYEHGVFESCTGGVCRYASRMPLLPLFYTAIAQLWTNATFIAIVKDALLGAFLFGAMRLLIDVQRPLHGSRIVTHWTVVAFVLVLAPSVSKHAGAIDYEEGITNVLLFVWVIAFVLGARLAVAQEPERERANLVVGLALFSALVAFLIKDSTILVLALTVFASLFWAYKFRAWTIAGACALSIAIVGLWGLRNLEVSGRFSLQTSWSGENLFRGWNAEAAQIYPNIHIDRLFDSSRIILPDGEVLPISPKPSLEPEPVGRLFQKEWDWSDYYKARAFEWGSQHPEEAAILTLKKILVLIVYVDKYPVWGAADTPAEQRALSTSRTKQLEIWAIRIWLTTGRLFELALAGMLVVAARKGGRAGRVTAAAVCLALFAYAVPCVVGYCFERHVTPFLMMVLGATGILSAELSSLQRDSKLRST